MEFINKITLIERLFHDTVKGEESSEVRKLVETDGALECPTKSLPPFVSSSPAPHLIEEGQPKNAGRSPRDYFCVAVPDEGGGRRG